jgi:hypothetical protein
MKLNGPRDEAFLGCNFAKCLKYELPEFTLHSQGCLLQILSSLRKKYTESGKIIEKLRH